MSRVLIDTSTIINFEKLSIGIANFSNPNAIIQRHPLDVMLVDIIENVIEAFLFYDEIILDAKSLNPVIGTNIWRQLDERPYCKFISIPESEEEKVYTQIISKFDVSPNNLVSLVNAIPQDWAPFFDSHDNLSLKGFIRNEEVIGSYYTAYAHSCIELIQKRQLDKHLVSIPKQVTCEIVRYLYYIYLQNRENAHLIIHPCRDVIPIMMDVNENPFNDFLSESNKIWGGRIRERCNAMPDLLPIPFIASYILSRTSSFEELFEVIEDVRNSKEAIKFRQAYNELISYVKNNDEKNLERIRVEFRDTLLNWEDNLNIVPGYRFKSLNIANPLVGFDMDIPYIGGNKTARNLMTFIHKSILKDDDYRKFKMLFQDCYGYRRPNF